LGTAPDQCLVSEFCAFLERQIFQSSARDTAHVFPLGYELLIIHSCPCFCTTQMGPLYLSYAIGNSFLFPALHHSNVRSQILLRTTPTLTLTIQVAPPGQSCPMLRKENRHTSALLLKCLRWRPQQGQESRLWNSPQAVAMESKKNQDTGAHWNPLEHAPMTCLPREQRVVLLGPKVWNGCQWGQELAIGITCLTT
jgi:hypothetical protein